MGPKAAFFRVWMFVMRWFRAELGSKISSITPAGSLRLKSKQLNPEITRFTTQCPGLFQICIQNRLIFFNFARAHTVSTTYNLFLVFAVCGETI